MRLSLVVVLAIFGLSSQAASAANLVVDDDQAQCPAALYSTVQSAVNAAVSGDTVVVCEGTYSEGTGMLGTSGLTITKSINIKGAGADKVTIQPTRATPTGGRIAAGSPVLRDGIGNIVSVNGQPENPIQVNISGVTVSGGGDKVYFDPNIPQPIWNGEFEHGVYAEAGVVFLDAGGSFNSSRVTNVVTSETPAAEGQPGGYRSNDLGWALAQVSAATVPPASASLPLQIKGSRFDRYNRGGILIDGAVNDSGTLVSSGNPQEAAILRSTVVGRQLNSPPLDGSGGGNLLTTGTAFGQDGIRVTSGSSLSLNASDVFQNLPAGTGADTLGQLTTAAGLRFIAAGSSGVYRSNIEQNGYGVINVQADGTTANTGVPVTAYENWWGVPRADGTVGSPVVNTGPGVSPGVLPTRPNNPVNGSPDANFGSDAVHFQDVAHGISFREGNEADADGHWPVADTPAPVADNPPSISVRADKSEVEPGGQVTLTADASDDFGVAKLTFYQGDTLLGTVTPPDDSVVWTAPESCDAAQTFVFSVFAEDSEGQESFGDVSVAVGDCPPVPEPTVKVDSPARIAQNGTAVTATAASEAGISKVTFYLGSRQVCEDATAPYSCKVLPRGDEIGTNVVRVVATDAQNRTAEDTSPVTVDQFKARNLVLKVKRVGKKRTRMVAFGRLVPPARMTAADACAASRVDLTARTGRTLLANRQVALSGCRYKLAFAAPKRTKKKRVVIKARFPGNDSLLAAARVRKVR
ncbi:MAG: hypothetical protein J0H98_07720 [Solirubrobacterales bacterium]|nr:hypothetical protein [Solirubrobacterales bacterium]